MSELLIGLPYLVQTYKSYSGWIIWYKVLLLIVFFRLPYVSKVSAAISSSGELRFLSEPTLSDTEPELTDARLVAHFAQTLVTTFTGSWWLNTAWGSRCCKTTQVYDWPVILWFRNTVINTDWTVFFHRARRKKKVKKSGVPAPPLQATVSDADALESTNTRRGRSTDRPLPKRPTGRTNGAFVPDT